MTILLLLGPGQVRFKIPEVQFDEFKRLGIFRGLAVDWVKSGRGIYLIVMSEKRYPQFLENWKNEGSSKLINEVCI